MSWCDQPPVEPGWYRVAYPRGSVGVVHVREGDDGLWVALPGGSTEHDLARLPWKWWGARVELPAPPVPDFDDWMVGEQARPCP